MGPEVFGEAIYAMRRDKKIGLRELARAAGLSASALSQIEKGRNSPTLATVYRILQALGTDFTTFFANSQTSDHAPVFPSRAMKTASSAQREYVFAFTKQDDLNFQIVKETILPTEKQSEWEAHEFAVGGLMLSGDKACVDIEEQGTWIIKRGDAFYIKAGLKHRVKNLGKRPLKLITVMSPARY